MNRAKILGQNSETHVLRIKIPFHWLYILLLNTGLFILLQSIEKARIHGVFFGIFALGVVLLLTKPRIGIMFYISVCLLSSDVSQLIEIGRGTFNQPPVSIHTVSVGNFAIMPLWTISVLFVMLLQMSMRKAIIIFRPKFDKIIFYIGLIFLFAGAIGLINLLESPRIYISDASYFINMATAYFAVRIYFQKERDLKQLVMVIISCLVIWSSAGILLYILGIGAITDTLIKPVVDSCRSLFPLLVFASVATFYIPGISASFKISMILFGFAGIFNILTYASRGNIIFLLFGILLLLFLLRGSNTTIFEGMRKFKKIIIPSVILIVLALLSMHYIRPGCLNYIVWKFESLFSISLFDPIMKNISSAEVRWLSFLNIIHYLWNTGKIVWGTGLGGYFSDNYILFASYVIGKSAFPDEWILNNTLYKPHGTQLFILLKIGVFGIFAYYGVLLLFFLRSWKAAAKIRYSYLWYSIYSACIAFLPLLYYKNYISKIQIFMGIIMAVIVNIVIIHYRKEN